jgi:ATP-dependent HslUV protease ATP-binding subunit HslU
MPPDVWLMFAPIRKERTAFIVGHDGIVQREEHVLSHREMILLRLREGELNSEFVEIGVSSTTHHGMESARVAAAAQLGGVFESMFASPPTKRKRVRVAQAMESLMRQESNRLIDMDNITREALHRAQQSGIVFLDEIDKIARPSGQKSGANPDVSREGVQRDLLPIVEGTSVSTKYGSIKTDHILFIAAGAFHVCRPSDLIPELQGRFPIRVELDRLTEDDFTRILKEPKNSLCRQYIALMATEGVEVDFDEGAVEAIARMAWRANESMENIGARRLHTIMEKIFEDLSFHAPERSGSRSLITPEYISERMDKILADDDLSHYIL